MSSHAALYSDASRSKSGILTPTSDASLNKSCHDDEPRYSDSRERKRSAPILPMEDLLNPTIVVKVRNARLLLKNHDLVANWCFV